MVQGGWEKSNHFIEGTFLDHLFTIENKKCIFKAYAALQEGAAQSVQHDSIKGGLG